ncbi:hypothetical protein PV325_000395, partial [Microctonus aethiopoides]
MDSHREAAEKMTPHAAHMTVWLSPQGADHQCSAAGVARVKPCCRRSGDVRAMR